MMHSEKFEQLLIERYGPLMTRQQLAELLHRSEGGLHYMLSHPGTNEQAHALNRAKTKLGRSVYFRTCEVSALLSGDME